MWTDTVTCCLGWQLLWGAAPSCWRLPAPYFHLRKVQMLQRITQMSQATRSDSPLSSQDDTWRLSPVGWRHKWWLRPGVQSRVNPWGNCARQWHRYVFVVQEFGYSLVNPNPTVQLPSAAWATDPAEAAIPQSKPTTTVTDSVQWSPSGASPARSAPRLGTVTRQSTAGQTYSQFQQQCPH